MLSRNHTQSTVLSLSIALCLTAVWVQAQDAPAPGEVAKQPVYRVGTTNPDDGPKERTARSLRPQSGPSLVPGAKMGLQGAVRPAAAIPTAAGTVKHPTLLQALADAEQCLQNIQSTIRDYSCVLVRRETVNGVQLKPECIHTKIRHRVVKNGEVVAPFSIYMRVVKPNEYKGRELLYVEGANKGKMLLKEGGTAGRWLPSVWLSTTSPIIMKNSRHPITDAGIENLTLQLLERGYADDGNVAEKDYTVEYRDGAELNGRSCKHLRIEFFTRSPINDAEVIEMFFDEGLMIPIRYVAHGWPTSPGARPPILEEYNYLNLKLNCGLTDKDFSSKNPKYRF